MAVADLIDAFDCDPLSEALELAEVFEPGSTQGLRLGDLLERPAWVETSGRKREWYAPRAASLWVSEGHLQP